MADDPQAFFAQHPNRVIIDEVQRLPELLSYIQAHVDEHKKMGGIVISGSQNLLLSEHISQSLAGRAAYQAVFPFSMQEMLGHNIMASDVYAQILKGFYPALYDRELDPYTYYSQYIATYVERDARLVKNIQNLSQFQKFIELLAGRVGQLVNTSSLASDAGISPNTAQDWISILEASYIVYQLRPYHANIGKRLIKAPKVYFYDTGLLCALLNISSPGELTRHFAIGGIFENLIIAEVIKHLNTSRVSAAPYFYRDSQGHEIDLVLDTGTGIIPVEIKSSMTYDSSFFDTLSWWRQAINKETYGFVVYAGDDSQTIKNDKLIGWRDLNHIFDALT